MKSNILKLSVATITLCTGLNLVADSTNADIKLLKEVDINSFNSTEDKQEQILQIGVGSIDFKNLGKKRGFIDIKYARSFKAIKNSGTSLTVFEAKLSKPYKDFSATNVVPSIYTDNAFSALFVSFGVMAHDIKSMDINEPAYNDIQKSPYIGFGAGVAYLFNGITANAIATYKFSLDRADLLNSYDLSGAIGLGNWHIEANYNKFNFNGRENQEDVSLKLAYSYSF